MSYKNWLDFYLNHFIPNNVLTNPGKAKQRILLDRRDVIYCFELFTIYCFYLPFIL